jgi:hypothetical protein
MHRLFPEEFNKMKKNLLRFVSFLTVGLFLSISVFAQDDRIRAAAGDIYVISAKAGGVNFIEGKVAVARKNNRAGYLIKGDNVEIGDKVSTGNGGKAEILLNPGSYLRLGENSTFEFVSTDLDDLQIKLNSGSAMFEVFADEEFKVTVDTPKANFYLVQSGIYRVDVLPDGNEKIEVWKGKAHVGSSTIVKGGRSALISGNQATVEKFDRDEKDDLELWSKSRAKELAKINAKLERKSVRDSLMTSFNNRGWSLYDSFGLWVYNRTYGTYCFLPFGYGWQSPYGYGFGYNFWDYKMPRYIYYNPMPNPQQPGRGGSNQPPASSSPSMSEKRSNMHTPPFERMQRAEDRRAPVSSDVFTPSMPSRSSAPVMMPPASSAPQSKKGGN